MPPKSAEEKAAARRLTAFHRHVLQGATSVGFRYFDLYVRGREEILVVVHQPHDGYPVTRAGSANDLLATNSNMIKASLFDLNNIENMSELRVHTDNTEPPASPCETEIYKPKRGDTAFLVGSYQRYKRPLVWIRSHHEQINSDGDQMDLPLDLKSTADSRWLATDVKVWEIISELVGLCVKPPPVNPLSIDRDFFEAAHGPEAALTSGATIKFLESAFLHKNSEIFRHKIYNDLMYLRRIHFQGLMRSQQSDGNAVRRRGMNLAQSVEMLCSR